MSNKQNDNLIEELQEKIDEMQWSINVSEQFIADIGKRIPIILDFVERWNKQDKEKDVAEAARFLGEYFDAVDDVNDKLHIAPNPSPLFRRR